MKRIVTSVTFWLITLLLCVGLWMSHHTASTVVPSAPRAPQVSNASDISSDRKNRNDPRNQSAGANNKRAPTAVEEREIADYTASLSSNPQDVRAYYGRGMIYARLGQLEQAIADYNAALQINPQYALAYFNQGLAYEKLGHKAEALDAYQQFLLYATSRHDFQNLDQAKRKISDLDE